MRRFFAIGTIPLLLATVPAASAAPVMPMGFESRRSDDSGRTWREMGTLAQPYAMARITVCSSMRGQGYKRIHDIAENASATRSLQLWRRADEDVILMFWQEDLYTTGVAWGLVSREDEGEPLSESSGTLVDSTEPAQRPESERKPLPARTVPMPAASGTPATPPGHRGF